MADTKQVIKEDDKPIFIQETFVNETKGYQFGATDVYETWTNEKGKLYKSLVKEYGRCTGKVYRDTVEKTIVVGWIFEKRMKYDDARGNDPEKDYYLRHVWVTLHEAPPTKTIQYHYKDV